MLNRWCNMYTYLQLLAREMEEKRESKEAETESFGNFNQFLEYKEEKKQEIELLKTISPSLKRFYKLKVNEYFKSFKK